MDLYTALRASAFSSVPGALLCMLVVSGCSDSAEDLGDPLGRVVQAIDATPLRVEGGAHHTLVLRSNGAVWAFGGNAYGQLGDGTTTNRLTPVQVAGLSAAVDI